MTFQLPPGAKLLEQVWPFDDIAPFSFDLILADPPWDFKLYSEAGDEKSASAHYDTMPLEDIKRMPVGHLAGGDCLLLLFACAPMLPQALEVVSAWGFTYKSEMMWRKTTKNNKVRWGPGYRVRTMHEPLLVCTIGNPKHKAFPSIFDGLAREHSRKPEEIYALINKTVPTFRKLDLFSRQTRPGWTNWGKESTKFDESAPVVTRRERRAKQPAPPEPMGLFPDVADATQP